MNSQISEILREADTKASDVLGICRKHGISEATFYQWRRQFGGPTSSGRKLFEVMPDIPIKLTSAALVRKIFDSKFVASSMAALIAQQALVASSNVWLVRATGAAASGGAGVDLYTGLFVGSLLAPYLPGALSQLWANSWNHDVTEALMRNLAAAHFCNTSSLWNDKHASAAVSTIFASEGRKVVSEAVSSIHDAAACSLNVILNISTLAVLLDPWLGVAYSVSVVLGAAFIKSHASQQAHLGNAAHKDEMSLTDHSKAFSDNVMLGNKVNFERWSGRAWSAFKTWRNSSYRAVLHTKIVSVGTAFLTAAPVLGTILVKMHSQHSDPAALAATLVSLPRLLNTMNYIDTLTSFYVEAAPTWSKVKNVYGAIATPPPQVLEKRIQADKITLTCGARIASVMELIDNPSLLTEPGRWVLRGKNKAGKSTLLCALKSYFGASAYYLPAKHSLDTGSQGPGSSGQEVMTALDDIFQDGDLQILLLDEWDANLDNVNRALINSRLDEVAKTKAVVEVTHNRPHELV